MTTGPRSALGALLLVCSLPTAALEWELETDAGPLAVELRNTVSAGASWRAEARDPGLVGKANLPENRELCAPDDCIGLSESDTEPNARFLAAPGQTAAYTDDGNLNYDRGDLVFATAKWNSRLNLDWDRFGFEFSGIYFFDPVNQGFDESRPNIILPENCAGEPGQDCPQPGVAASVPRSANAEESVGSDFVLRNANLWLRFPVWNEQQAELRVGRQVMTWGVATFGIGTNINIINPADLNALARPGGELFELFTPQNMVTLKAGITEDWGFDAWYQLEWRPYGFPAKGSFFSFFDAGNEPEPGEAIPLPFSKVPDDPQQVGTPASPLAAAVSATSFSALRDANREPPDTGQFGFSLYHYADWLGGGTEIGFHFANYHSRIPSASFTASQASCTRREGNPNNNDTSNLLEFLDDCGVPFVDTPGEDGFEALPIDTARYFLDYPEDIRMFALSFNRSLLGANLHGELSYRPNQPVQVDLEDVFFSALQPVFPRNEITIVPDGVGNLLDAPVLGPILDGTPGLGPLPSLGALGGATLTDSRTALPDYVTAFRGGEPGETAPGSYVRGYEEMEMFQLSLGFLRLWGPDTLPGADQLGWLFEANAIWLPELPPLERLQLEGPGTFTHFSPGVAETGNGLRINPRRTTDGFVTEWSGGYRTGLLAVFNDAFMPGLMIRPTLVLLHDLHGVAPGLAENHLEGRIISLSELHFRYREVGLDLQYALFAGAGRRNPLGDRDAITVTLSYQF